MAALRAILLTWCGWSLLLPAGWCCWLAVEVCCVRCEGACTHPAECERCACVCPGCSGCGGELPVPADEPAPKCPCDDCCTCVCCLTEVTPPPAPLEVPAPSSLPTAWLPAGFDFTPDHFAGEPEVSRVPWAGCPRHVVLCVWRC